MCIKKSLIDKFGAALFFMGVRVELNSRLIHCWESRTRLIIQPNLLPNYTNAIRSILCVNNKLQQAIIQPTRETHQITQVGSVVGQVDSPILVAPPTLFGRQSPLNWHLSPLLRWDSAYFSLFLQAFSYNGENEAEACLQVPSFV